MSGEVGLVIANIVTRVEATTADTAIGGRTSFRMHEGAWSGEDLTDLKSPTRAFCVEVTGDRTLGEMMGQTHEPTDVMQTFDLVVAYRMGASAHGLLKVICEDVDRLGYELERTDGDKYASSTTSLYNRNVSGFDLEPDENQGGVILVRIPIECHYRPNFS